MPNHPNATTAGVSGALGLLLLWSLGKAGVDFTAEEGSAVVSGFTSVVLLVGRDGLKGIAKHIWSGASKK